MEEKTIQCYLYANPDGSIQNAQQGKNIIPSEEWDFFFLLAEEINIDEYKVVIDLEAMKPDLVKKEGQ